jgi:exoribonuclease-2
MPIDTPSSDATILERIAHQAMLERGLLPDFSAQAMREAKHMPEQAELPSDWIDLRSRLWCSIDNDDSRDLDQLAVAEAQPLGQTRVLVAIADVAGRVHLNSAIDQHARHNTTSVYTPAKIFPMLPERLSTDLTSLNPNEDRPAVVVDMIVDEDGEVEDAQVYPALVRNQAQLAYNDVAAWLEGGEAPEGLRHTPGLARNLRLQAAAAQRLKRLRTQNGALNLETIQGRPAFAAGSIKTLHTENRNRAKEIIEDFMVAANGVTARFLEAKGMPSLRRVVTEPKRWERIVEIARQRGATLPTQPNPKALNQFLAQQKARDALRFPDLSLTIIKLMGAGEYRAEAPGETPPGHFGLAVRDYAHSTAPNRRYPDLITQRLLLAALAGRPSPYSMETLRELAQHCTRQEDAANKVERQLEKSAAALLFQSKIGQHFDALVTGAADKGTWVRLIDQPVEGKLVQGFQGADVGDRLRVQLIDTDVDRGYIDFKRV